uniref:Protein MON2 homolog n=1 Tax=Hyaloperonospora arabidopsidis (strain Emoy2) TaxID=559515 RepID=M4BDA2_HYAAE
MTIRQLVSLAFSQVDSSPAAKRVGVLLFQDLCFISQEESGVWLKRTAVSPMSAALAVELLETIVASHKGLFRLDVEFTTVLKQQMVPLMQSVLEMSCNDKHGGSAGSGITGPTNTSITSSSTNGAAGSFFPLLARGMRLASTLLCHFADCLVGECALILHALLEIIATGTYTMDALKGPQSLSNSSPSLSKSPRALSKSPPDSKYNAANAIANFKEAKSFLAHSNLSIAGASNASGSTGGSINFVTWPVLLSLEVLSRVCQEPDVVAAMVSYPDGVLVAITRTTSSVIMTSPPSDFKPQGPDATALRSGLELLNEQETPVLQQFYMAVRVAASCQCNMAASVFELSRSTVNEKVCEKLAKACVAVVAPAVVKSMNCVMRHCREVDLVTMSLKAYHVLATIASRLRANMQSQTARETWCQPMDEVVLTCLRALCGFSFPLPDGIRGNTKASISTTGSGSSGSIDNVGESGADDGESCLVTISWREVHAMKALFGAAHVMEEELSETEWCALLEGFEIIVDLTDAKRRKGQQKLPTKTYRIRAFRIEDEDVEQQLVMLSNSVVDLIRGAHKLSSAALQKLLSAVRRVLWDQVGLPIPNRDSKFLSDSTSTESSTDGWKIADEGDAPSSTSFHRMKIYQSYLGVGLTGTGSFTPCFALRMLTQLASSSKRCFDEVMRELVFMSTYELQAPLTAVQFPQLDQFQMFATDSILQLMQNVLQHIVSSALPTAKSTMENRDIEREGKNPTYSHAFDQQELFMPLLKLVRSDMKDRTLTGMLEMLNACGHLISAGWPLVFATIQEACTIGDGKTQVLAFKCLRLIVDDLVVSIPSSYLPDCIKCIGRFGSRAKDVNISLTAVNELWSVADVIGKQKTQHESDSSSQRRCGQWRYIFAEFSSVALNDRVEVRNSAINTLFGTAVTYGAQFELSEWQSFMNSTVLPLAAQLCEIRDQKSSISLEKIESKASTNVMLHHSRDNSEKQWNESRVLMLTGISRVLETNLHHLLQHASWFVSIWRNLLQHVALNAAFGVPKEVVLAAIKTLQMLLQVSSAGDFDHIAQSQRVRAGVGMRVVGGALVSSSTPTSATLSSLVTRRVTSTPVFCDPRLWEEAFRQLLRLCDERRRDAEKDKNSVHPWKEEEEQEIASAVVSVLRTLYVQAKEHEFRNVRNVEKMLDLFAALTSRHILDRTATEKGAVTKTITNISTNSLQSRVLDAFEECDSFAFHPEVHTKVLDQLVDYVTLSSAKGLVFFTRHALISLAKLYASVSAEAKEKRFLSVLFCIQPFLRFETSHDTLESSSSAPPDKPMTAAQKAATQLWKHALRVLLVIISSGLVAVRLAEACWRPLLETITYFVQPNRGKFPLCVQSEEDEVLVLSVLECVVDSTISLLDDGSETKSHLGSQYNAFISDLVAVLCSGVDAVEHNKSIIRCYVRQLSTMCIQTADQELALFACARLVVCCNTALVRFADLSSSTLSKLQSSDMSDQIHSSSSSDAESDIQYVAARERVVVLLTSALEVDMQPRSILEMYSSLCGCISSSDLVVRQLVQQLLLSSRLSEFRLELMDVWERESQ